MSDSINLLKDYTIVMIDNFDSFTYNLVNQLASMVKEVKIYRNDVSVKKIKLICEQDKNKVILVISPGPGSPKTAGNVLTLLSELKGKLPILGVCLGHQAIIESFGGVISHAKKVVHGKSHQLEVTSHGSSLFDGMTPFYAARYHSLSAINVPKNFDVLAYAENEVMLVKVNKEKIIGIQFHPESILTPNGTRLMQRVLIELVKE